MTPYYLAAASLLTALLFLSAARDIHEARRRERLALAEALERAEARAVAAERVVEAVKEALMEEVIDLFEQHKGEMVKRISLMPKILPALDAYRQASEATSDAGDVEPAVPSDEAVWL